MNPRVLLLHTGGTLGMRPRHPDQALAPDEFGPTILSHAPEIGELAKVEAQVLFNLDSSDLGPAQWLELARAIAKAIEQDRCDGIVVTHGTDAMAYTASALSFLLRNLPCPVVLTGSQRPLADPRSDGRGNLVGAVDLATRGIREVGIYFDGVLHRGNRATKDSTFAYGAYRSPNFLPLAEVGVSVKPIADPLDPLGPFRLEGRFDPRVSCVRLLPGEVPAGLEALAASEVRGLLVQAFGCGNLPTHDWRMRAAIERLIAEGVVVAIGSQAPHGTVNLRTYAGGRLAERLGAVGIADMTLEAAAVKLMYLLGTLEAPAAVRDALAVPIAGELSDPVNAV
jgi:L-asparaginase